MLLGRPIDPRKAFATGVIFCGSFALIKLMQDSRYMRKDLKMLTETQLSERDLEKIKEKYKLTSKDLETIKIAQKQKKPTVDNLIETDPNFTHKKMIREEKSGL